MAKRRILKKSVQDSAIEDRIAACGRGESEHIIYIGELVERTIQGEFGSVLKALTAGRISIELQSNKDGKLSSDRILGRCEMAESLWNDLEQYILDKDIMVRPRNNVPSPDIHTATEPEPRQYEDASFTYGQ